VPVSKAVSVAGVFVTVEPTTVDVTIGVGEALVVGVSVAPGISLAQPVSARVGMAEIRKCFI
jgi:hypothetical protein